MFTYILISFAYSTEYHGSLIAYLERNHFNVNSRFCCEFSKGNAIISLLTN